MKTGDNIKRLRQEKGMTQTDLSKPVSVIKQTISAWENNITEPNIETLIQLANIFNITIDELVGRDLKTYLRPDNKKKPADIADLLADPEATWCGELLTEKEKNAIQSIMALRETQPIKKSHAA